MTKKKRNQYLIFVLIFLLAAIGSFFFFKILNETGMELSWAPKLEGKTEKIIGIAGMVPMLFVILGIHELGHLITGLYQGFQFQLFIVGPLGIKREDDRVKVYLNRSMAMFGGVAATSPTNTDDDNARKFAYILLGGPLTSLIAGILMIGLAGLMTGVPAFWGLTGGAMSIAIFFATTIPSKTGMFFTDRKRYQRLIIPGPDQDVELALLRIMGQYSKKQSYKDLSPEDIALVTADSHDFIKMTGLLYQLCRELETEKSISEASQTQYNEVAAGMSAAIQKAFEGEINRMKQLHESPELTESP